MGKTIKLYLAGIFLLVLIILLIDTFRIKPTNWKPTYSLDYKNPFDLYVFNREIKNIIPENRITRILSTPYEYIQNQTDTVTYLMIRQNMYFIGDTVILEKVKEGSNLFVSSENFVRNITDSLALKYTEADSDLSLKKLDMLTLSLTNKNWSKADYQMKPVNNTFAFVDADAATTTILGTEKLPDGKIYPNFLKIKYGKGYVFIHNQPQVFTNHALLSEQSSAGYVAHLLSYIPKDRPVVWFVQGQTLNPNAPKNETGLSVVFRYPALRAVWLLLVYGLLLYIFFNSKRRQRIVPVIKPLRNTTVEFVQTIGNLYYQQGNTANVIDKKIVFFLDRIRTGYFIDTSKLDERFAEKLKSKSEKDIELITEIIDFINEFRKNKTAEKKDLIHINKLIEAFWDKNIKQE
ncbi:MAG: hypothetical protein KA172_09130 [Paludibacter sp.]|nr:hypothetical protein [Paludibacter sp.]